MSNSFSKPSVPTTSGYPEAGSGPAPLPPLPGPRKPSSVETLDRGRYPTDLTDAQWRRVRALVERTKGRGRRPNVSIREIVNAMHYRWRTGCTWRMLPHDFPPWNTVYFYYRTWRRKGILPRLQAMLIERPTVIEQFKDEMVEKRRAS